MKKNMNSEKTTDSNINNNIKVYKMLYKMSLSVNEIPPLFVQLDQLEHCDLNDSTHWKEKARWIRFEEQAEDVLGRWSKPHVATLTQTSLEELKDLLINGKMMLDVMLTDMKEIADAVANELLDYFNDFESARRFAELLCVPHHHHHEKKAKKNSSSNNLPSLNKSSSNFVDLASKRENESLINEKSDNANANLLLKTVSSKNNLKYQYSFTDSIMLDDVSFGEFKENTKFKKKVHRKAEGASILVAPVDFVTTTKLLFIRLEAATELQSLLEVKIRSRFIVLIIGPSERQVQLYETGRAISTCLADDVCRELFYSAQSQEEILQVVHHFNRGTMVIPPSEWNPKIRIEPPEKFLSKEERTKVPELSDYIHDNESKIDHEAHGDPTLKGSRKPFNGLYNDIKRKLPHYLSDFTDFFSLQCFATTLYMYLVSLCSLVAFGGMLGKKTDNYMATMECILAGSVCGVLFSLFSGQPLNVISATGPMLILESIIKDLCDKNSVDFMEFRLWVGLWTALFLALICMFNLSFLVKYITRFTEDCFATLVAIIFIIDAIKSTIALRKVDIVKDYKVYQVANLTNMSSLFNETMLSAAPALSPVELELQKSLQNSKFLFSVILFLLTFFVCSTLKGFRTKPYLPSKVREILSDFAVLIAIVIASAIDSAANLGTLKLTIPSVFQPTRIDARGWFIPFYSGKNPWVTILIAIAPALIATILVFMDQQITAVIINRKEFKMKKSNGYHLDLFIIASTIALCSVLGLPWFVAATVLALSHINSLKVMSENTAPGEKPVFMGVREQRASTLIMSILVGLSVFLTSILCYIPMAVLYGVFLFMGVSALNGMQFFERILILFMPAKHQPDLKYLRYVNTKRVHLFTAIQLVSTSGLYLIKFIESVAILFPVLVLATCGIRKLLDSVFTQSELFWLDDILPGATKHKVKIDPKDSEHNLSSQNIYNNKRDFNQSKSLEHVSFSNKNENHMFSSNESSNNNLSVETDPNIRFIDGVDENNSLLRQNGSNYLSENHYSRNNPVRFVTSFHNIKENEDKVE